MPLSLITLDAFLATALSVTTGYIAIAQYRLARQQMNLARYDRRVEIYRAFKEFQIALNGSTLNEKDAAYSKFSHETAEAQFLFGRDVQSQLSQLHEEARALLAIEDDLQELPMFDVSGPPLKAEKKQAWQNLRARYPKVEEAFSKYLKL